MLGGKNEQVNVKALACNKCRCHLLTICYQQVTILCLTEYPDFEAQCLVEGLGECGGCANPCPTNVTYVYEVVNNEIPPDGKPATLMSIVRTRNGASAELIGNVTDTVLGPADTIDPPILEMVEVDLCDPASYETTLKVGSEFDGGDICNVTAVFPGEEGEEGEEMSTR